MKNNKLFNESNDQRNIILPKKKFENILKPQKGQNLYWTTDKNEELPILVKPIGVGSERPITLTEMFYNTCKKYNDKKSMYIERQGKIQSYSWGEYFDNAIKMAKSMTKLGVQERAGVAIMGYNTPEWCFTLMGGIMNNNIITGLYPTNEPKACKYQINHCEAEIVIVETQDQLQRINKKLKKMPQLKAIVIYGETTNIPNELLHEKVFLWNDFIKIGQNISDQIIFDKIQKQTPNQTCLLIYTSGTTGNPKGVMLTHDNLTWTAKHILNRYYQEKPELSGPQNRLVSYLPLSHVGGLSFDIMQQIYYGFEVYFAQPDALKGTIVKTLKWARPTIWFAVPRIWEKFEEAIKESKSSYPKEVIGLDKCYYYCYAAAPLKQSSVQFFASIDIILYNIYGMSESSGAFVTMTQQKYTLDTSGFVIPGLDILIANQDQNGEGEICMRGRGVTKGYLKNQKATFDTIDSEGFLHTGDKGIINKQGRIKELIITAGGENIAPVPIEDRFKEICPPCSNIMVVGEQHRFLAAIITFKVDMDAKGGPSKNLMAVATQFFNKEIGVDVKTTDEACQHPKIIEFVQRCVELTNNKSVSRAAHIKKFALINVDFSIGGQELTQTLKLKRKVTEKKHQAIINQMFAAAKL